MSITVKYFASLREQMGKGVDTLTADRLQTVQDVWSSIASQSAFPSNLLVAVNMEYADLQHPVKDGDEVAFFPPVTGG